MKLCGEGSNQVVSIVARKVPTTSQICVDVTTSLSVNRGQMGRAEQLLAYYMDWYSRCLAIVHGYRPARLLHPRKVFIQNGDTLTLSVLYAPEPLLRAA